MKNTIHKFNLQKMTEGIENKNRILISKPNHYNIPNINLI